MTDDLPALNLARLPALDDESAAAVRGMLGLTRDALTMAGRPTAAAWIADLLGELCDALEVQRDDLRRWGRDATASFLLMSDAFLDDEPDDEPDDE